MAGAGGREAVTCLALLALLELLELLALLALELLLAAAAAPVGGAAMARGRALGGASREARLPRAAAPSAGGCALTRSCRSLGTRTSHMRRPAWEMSTVVGAAAAEEEEAMGL
jgi:hypothetical protein